MIRKQEIFEKVLKNKYVHDEFIGFTREFLNDIQLVAPNTYNKEYSNFSFYVAGYYHIGNYKTDEGDVIAVLSVNLNRGETVERARSMQRNFVKTLIERNGCAGAIVAFYTAEEPEKWRLSFIRMDYEFSKGKVDQKLTPAKRYSYLVGEKEPCTTALQRLFPIFDEDNERPSLDEIEEAFSVEKVTKEFFDKYVEKYQNLKEYLESNEDFMIEAKTRGFSSEQFAKKLLGQIVFLYFVQKKGWLGVSAIPTVLTEKQYNNAFYAKGAKSRKIVPMVYQKIEENKYKINVAELKAMSDEDEAVLATCVKGEPWGTGPRDFMRQIFNGCNSSGKNFFDDYLEPLFYTGLNLNRGENGFYAPLHRRIPFLNGGLFEQLDNYAWENNDFNIPNEIFSNVDKKGRDADGILDIFDRYNFTMNEDEPMEREVAIDPEMLGKVFENLLDVSDRKSKGAFYTPGGIVHYMCQESLVEYLVEKTSISEEAIRDFIYFGEFFKDEDTEKTLCVQDSNGKKHYEIDKEKDLFISEDIFSFKKNVNRLSELDDLLKNVKVADLAVGSGAFPLGMLNEIVKARETLTAYLALGMNNFQKKSFIAYGRKLYDLKVETIKNCIFACDIEPSAVDIAKLRLWLSIVIDDEITSEVNNCEFDAHTKPRQLPNLECNIICGNSLMDKFNGNLLISQSDLLNNTDGSSYQYSLFQSGVDNLLIKLIELQDKLFFIKEHNEKEEIREYIQDIYNQIILEQIGSDYSLKEAYLESVKETSAPFILWQLYFPKVFRDNGGFDIVIGNPPYGAKLSKEEKIYYKEKYADVHMRTPDTYNYFISLGLKLIKNNGIETFIVPNTLLFQNEYQNTRKLLSENNKLYAVINIGENVFERAQVPTCIFVAQKKMEDSYAIKYADFREIPNGDIVWGKYPQSIEKAVLENTPGNVLGIDSASSKIIEKIASKSVLVDDIADEVAAGISTGGNDVFIINEAFIQDNDIENDIIKPLLYGKIVDRYSTDWNDEYVIYSTKNSNTPQYKNLYEYMLPFEEKLSKKRETKKGLIPWWSLHWPRTPELFEQKKIVMRQTSDCIRATIDMDNYYALNSLLVLTLKSNSEFSYEFVLGILNSNVNNYIYSNLTQEAGRVFAEVKPKNVRKLYIPNMANDERKKIEELVHQLLENNGTLDDIQREIDEMLYTYYGLEAEEIEKIEEVSR